MRITRYPLNGVGARKRDPISDLQLPPSRFLSNETRFLLVSPPTILGSGEKQGRERGEKLVRSPLGRGWISFKLEISMAGRIYGASLRGRCAVTLIRGM